MTSSTNELFQCEKHSKKEEALAKLREGIKFDEVAREFSEDKARQGGNAFVHWTLLRILSSTQEGPWAGKQGAACMVTLRSLRTSSNQAQ